MPSVAHSLIAFLAILNPFALCLYLAGVMQDLPSRDFYQVVLRAAGISLLVFIVFSLSGEDLLTDVLGVRTEAMRAFGGVIFFMVGYQYVVRGYRTTEMLRGSLEELPSAIALPFMIGAGTITQAMLIGRLHGRISSVVILGLGMALAVAVIVAFKLLRDRVTGVREQVFDRYVNTLARANGLLLGSISTEMVVSGIHDLWFGSTGSG